MPIELYSYARTARPQMSKKAKGRIQQRRKKRR